MLKKQDIKTFKLYTQIKILKNLLINKNFILFFNFKFSSSQNQLILNKLLLDYNFKSIIIKKKTLKYLCINDKYKKLYHLCQGNILLIYSIDKNTNTNKKLVNTLLADKNLELIGAKIEDSIYRPSIVLKYITLTENIKHQPVINILTIVNQLKTILTLKKYNYLT
jgi:hypothetical protein